MKAGQAQGRVLQGDAMNAHNTFDNPNRVQPQAFHWRKPKRRWAGGDLAEDVGGRVE